MKLNALLCPVIWSLPLVALTLATAGETTDSATPEPVSHYLLAAESGDAEAMYSLAVIYKDVAPDYEEYCKWLHKAAEGGHAEAQFQLAVQYLFRAPDSESQEYWRLSAEWFRKAAEQGHAEAQCNLGVRYFCGQGVPESASEAAKWYRKAAEQGNAQAQFFLGDLYAEGEGVPQSFTEAEKWYRKAEAQYRKAVAQGNMGAKADLIRLLEKVQRLHEKAQCSKSGAAEKRAAAADELSIDIEL